MLALQSQRFPRTEGQARPVPQEMPIAMERSLSPPAPGSRGFQRRSGPVTVTGTEISFDSSGPSCVITTDSESHRMSRTSSQVQSIELRTYVFLDSLQPQLAAYMGTVSQGFLPIPGDACLWLEVSPGMAVHRVTDIALKASTVRLGQMIVERAFGSLALYHRDQSNVLHSGDVVLEAIGSRIEQRSRCEVSWTEIIRAITPDHAVLINRQNRRGSMIQAGMSMFILETEPAGYVLIAANEAERPPTSPWLMSRLSARSVV